MSLQQGKLYVVATPIGNLADISHRAVDTLKSVDLIAAEDTRHVKPLLNHYGIGKPLVSLHQHNEDKATALLLEKLRSGISVALVSDAGTPLMSDPGYILVSAAKAAGFAVTPIPGPCAFVTALSVAGLPVNRFCFEGFLPRTSSARQAFFTEKRDNPVTWVFYEASHRIQATLEDMATVLPADRPIVIARELTKLFETVLKTTLADALEQVSLNENMRKGEFVVIVEGAPETPQQETSLSEEQKRILTILLKHCSTKTAAEVAAEITGERKKLMYQAALDLTKDK